jgi:hypothetical protein
MNLREQVLANLDSCARSIDTTSKDLITLSELGLSECEGEYYNWSRKFTLTNLNPNDVTMFTRMLIEKVKKFDKNFDTSSGTMSLSAEYNGVKVILQYNPPKTCTVERVEEEIEIPEKPAIPAHKEKVVRFVTKGDCVPIMAQEISSD